MCNIVEAVECVAEPSKWLGAIHLQRVVWSRQLVEPSDTYPQQYPMLHPLDALTASPAHHKLILENAQVRVLETIINPGETTAPPPVARRPSWHGATSSAAMTAAKSPSTPANPVRTPAPAKPPGPAHYPRTPSKT